MELERSEQFYTFLLSNYAQTLMYILRERNSFLKIKEKYIPSTEEVGLANELTKEFENSLYNEGTLPHALDMLKHAMNQAL